MYKFVLNVKPSRSSRRTYRVQVVIYDRLEDLRRSVNGVFVDNSDTAGYYHACRGRDFGRIGLWKELVGAGYLAHEIQHFIYDCMMDGETNNEKLAWMAGDLTSKFWTKWYEMYP